MCILSLTHDSYIKYVFNGIVLGQNSRHLWFLSTLFLIFVLIINFNPKIFKQKNILFMLCFMLIINVLARYVKVVIVSTTMQYLFYFYLGVIINKFFYKLFNPHVTVIYIIIFLLVYFIDLVFNIPAVLVGTVGIFFFFSVVLLLFKKGITNNKLTSLLKKYSFGVYLFHPMIIYIIFYMCKDLSINPILLTFVTVIISVLVSCLIVRIIYIMKLNIILGK